MENSITKLTFGAIFIVIAIGAHAEDKNAPPNKTALVLESMASQSKTEAEFGRAVRTQALLAAAREFRKGTVKGNTVRIPVTLVVTELPPKYGNLPDACFETCLSYGQSSALTCYIDCNAPKPSSP
jgi:hypothetical protein